MNRRNFLKLSAAVPVLAQASAALAETFDYPWKLGIITDEASLDLPKVLHEFVPKYGLKWVEIRNMRLNGRNSYTYRDASPAQLRDIRKQLDDAGVKLSVLDTDVYKIPLPGTKVVAAGKGELNPSSGTYDEQLDHLKRGAEAAHILGTQKVRLFSFLRATDLDAVFQRVIDELGKAADVAKQNGVTLVMENEFSCNIATGAESGRMLRALPDRTLALNWDPGNAIQAGEIPFPNGWDQFDHSRIGHMHLKDGDGHRWLPIGSGKIDYVGQFRALKQMGYSQTMSLETHYRNAQHDPWTSSIESMDGLVRILHEV